MKGKILALLLIPLLIGMVKPATALTSTSTRNIYNAYSKIGMYYEYSIESGMLPRIEKLEELVSNMTLSENATKHLELAREYKKMGDEKLERAKVMSGFGKFIMLRAAFIYYKQAIVEYLKAIKGENVEIPKYASPRTLCELVDEVISS